MQGVTSVQDIRKRARWYVGVRWFYLLGIGIPGVVSLYVAYGYNQQVREDILLVMSLLAINAAFLIATYLPIRRLTVHRVLAVAQIVFDVSLMSAAFYLNRGSETPLAMLYAIPIVMTAAFFGRRSVYAVGLTTAGIFVTLSFLDFTRILPVKYIAAPQLHTDPKLFYPPLVTVVAIILAITFITDLVSQLIREREELVEDMRALAAHSAEIESLLRTMGSALVAVDRAGRISLVNNSFEVLTGWKRHEVSGKPLDDILPIFNARGQRLPAGHRPMLEFMNRTGTDKPVAMRSLTGYSYKRKDGSLFPFVGSVAPIRSRGQTIGFTTVFDDATEIKKLNQLKDNFIALISHQLKTPLGEINGYAYNLLGGIAGTMNAKQTEYVTNIQELAARSGGLIQDLLGIVLAGRGDLTVRNEPSEIAPIITRVVELHTAHLKRKGLHLETSLPPHRVYIRGDEQKLVQALGNFLDNAIAYSKHGAIALSVEPGDETVEIYLRDHGSGMSQATVDAVFGEHEPGEPLTKAPTAEGGTGLGMQLAKELVALMGGSVRLVRSSKRGTTICVSLRRVKP